MNLSWTAGTNGNGYAIAAAANGASSNCTAASFSALTTTAGTSITDTGRFTPQGTFECYRVTTTFGTWSSQAGNPTVAVRLGVVAQAIAVANGGTAGRLDQGDTIVITFNQAITTASGPVAANNVCTNTGGTVMLGVTGTGASCSTATATTIGTLTSLTINRAARYDATYAWSAGNTVLTVTIGSRSAGSAGSDDLGHGGLHADDHRHRAPLRDRLVPYVQLELRRRQLHPVGHRQLLSPATRRARRCSRARPRPPRPS